MKGRRRVYLQGEDEHCRSRWHRTASANLIRGRFHRASPSRIAAPGPSRGCDTGSSSVRRDDITVRVPAAWELPGFETRLHDSLINSNGAAARGEDGLPGDFVQCWRLFFSGQQPMTGEE